MKKLSLAVVLSLLFLPSITTFAAPQTADEVIEKHLAALGGREALAKITSRKGVGTVVLGTPNGDLPGSVEMYAKAPNKSRAVIKLDLSAMGMPEPMVIDQRFDGTNGWALNSLQGDTPITGNQLDNMRNNSFPTSMLNYKEMGVKVELLPNATVNGKETVVLQMTPKTGSVSKIFLDPQTWMVVQSSARISSPEVGELEQVSTPSDYRTVDGVKVAFMVVNVSPVQSVTIKLTSVEHNVAIDDATFTVK